jgi:starvation-inducible DNA-binding protein
MPNQLISNHDLQPARQGELLQPCVLAAINLSLNLKQIHWNLRGAKFQTVHEFLDLVIDQARTSSDELAERMVTVGMAAMGRGEIVAAQGLPQVPDAFVTDMDALKLASDLLDRTIGIFRDARASIGEIDAVTEDLLIASIQVFEKQLWMLRSHLL